MDLQGQKLQGLRRKMGVWRSRLRAATYASSVELPSSPDGEFKVVVRWPEGKETRTYEKNFTRAEVFSPSGTGPIYKPCDYVRQIIQEVLRLRGAI